MSEEEKKAVELLEDIKNNSWTTKYIMSSDSKNAELLLNLIEKLQKENKKLTKSNKTLSKIVDSMAKHIYISGNYTCLYEECDDDVDRECEDCIKEYFYKKAKETKDNGSTRNI